MKRTLGLMLLALLVAGPVRGQVDEEATVARVQKLQGRLATLEAEGDSRSDDPAYYFEIGNVYSDLSRRDEAEAAYVAAIDLDPEYVEALVNLGSLRTELGRADEAIELLDRAAKLRPGESLTYVNLGNAHYTKGEYYLAMQQFRKALEIDPGSYEAHYQIAVAFADVGIYREAIREWKMVVELAPESEAAQSAQENIEVVEQILARRL